MHVNVIYYAKVQVIGKVCGNFHVVISFNVRLYEDVILLVAAW